VARRGSGYRLDYEVTDDDLLNDAEVWIEVIAPPQGNNPGQGVVIDSRSGQDGARCPATGQVATSQLLLNDGLSAVGSVEWTPARLASGAYQVRLVVSNGVHTVMHDVGMIDWQDTTPPAAPANLQAKTTADGALHLSWEPGDADTSGYRVRIGDGSVLEQRGRHLNEFWTTGFNPGDSVQVQVASVDPSGNASPFVGAGAGWSAEGIAVQEWIPRAEDRRVPPGLREVVVRFREPAEIQSFTVTGPDGPLAGAWQPITLFPSTNHPVAVGGRWTPDSGGLEAIGTYTAAVAGTDEDGSAFTLTWSWTVQEPVDVPTDLYVPTVMR
jgi:hypothetical protein